MADVLQYSEFGSNYGLEEERTFTNISYNVVVLIPQPLT